jgi:hypothetical protein
MVHAALLVVVAARGDVVERSGLSADDAEGDCGFLGKVVAEERGELLGGGEQFAGGAGYPAGAARGLGPVEVAPDPIDGVHDGVGTHPGGALAGCPVVLPLAAIEVEMRRLRRIGLELGGGRAYPIADLVLGPRSLELGDGGDGGVERGAVGIEGAQDVHPIDAG